MKMKAMNLILTAFSSILFAASAHADSCGVPCKKLDELARASVLAKGEDADRLISKASFVFQDVIRAQKKLDPATAHDMLTVVIQLLDEDKMLTAGEALYDFYVQKRFKPVFDEQLKKFSEKDQHAFQKAMREIAKSKKLDGNG